MSFNNLARISTDITDNTQHSLQNARFADYTFSSYFSQSIPKGHIKFATQQPSIILNGTAYGSGLNGQIIDDDSLLTIGNKQERPLEKLNLKPRIFATIPYLGRGSCDTDAESKLQQGDAFTERKTQTKSSEKYIANYSINPTDKMVRRVNEYNVEESALDGWVRGGNNSRYLANESGLNKKR